MKFKRNGGKRDKKIGSAKDKRERREKEGKRCGRKRIEKSIAEIIEKMKQRRKWRDMAASRKTRKTTQNIFVNNIGGGLREKWPEICEWIKREEPEVVMIQETKIKEREEDKFIVPEGYKQFAASLKKEGMRGVMTIIKDNLAMMVDKNRIIKDKEGRYLMIPCNTLMRGQTLWLENIYAPVSDKEISKKVKKRQEEKKEMGKTEEKKEEMEEEELNNQKRNFYRKQLQEVHAIMNKVSSAQDIKIVGMDANLVIEPTKDTEWEKYEGKNITTNMKKLERGAEMLKEWMRKQELEDIWRLQNPEKRQYTRKTEEGEEKKTVGKRIDYILVDSKHTGMVTGTEIMMKEDRKWNSDHEMIKIEILGMSIIRDLSKQIWQKQTFDMKAMEGRRKEIGNTVKEWAQQRGSGKKMIEELNKRIIKTLQETGVKQKKEKRDITVIVQRTEIEKELRKEEMKIAEEMKILRQGKETKIMEKRMREIWQKAKEKIEEGKTLTKQEKLVVKWSPGKIPRGTQLEIANSERIGILIKIGKIRKSWTELRAEAIRMKQIKGEKYGEWGREPWQQGKKMRRSDLGIRVLRNKQGEIKVNEESVEIVREYMGEMWGTKDCLGKIELEHPKVGKEKQEVIDKLLNKEISMEEINRAIKKLKKRKTPGEDLITNEVFMGMETKGREKLVEVLEECRKTNEFPEGWKETELRWIYKKDDPLQIKNYRPIALTDTLYKIFTRIMTERVEKVVEKYGMVADEQQGFRSDRSCLSASMALKILMARRMQKGQEKPFHVAYLDISKAYDTIDHEKLWEILKGMGIKGSWLENLKKLYKDNVIKSILPNGKTRGVAMKRGIRQGCPLSPILFAMYVEPITRMMKKVNPRPEEEPSMLLYADDMVLWGESKEELEKKLKTAMEVMKALGLKLSIEKTEIQHNKHQRPTMEGESIDIVVNKKRYEFKYLNMGKPIRYLGTWATANGNTEKGLQLLKEKMEERLGRIQNTNMHAAAKVKLIRGRVVSTWNYTAGVQQMDLEEIDKWEVKFREAILSKEIQI